jgi:hypothetical protein
MTCQADCLLAVACAGLIAFFVLWASACDSPQQTIHVMAEDFLLTPAEIRVSAERPIRLRIVNGGRERHEFKSPLLAHQIGGTTATIGSLTVLPNHGAEALMRAPSGIYLFIARYPATPA